MIYLFGLTIGLRMIRSGLAMADLGKVGHVLNDLIQKMFILLSNQNFGDNQIELSHYHVKR